MRCHSTRPHPPHTIAAYDDGTWTICEGVPHMNDDHDNAVTDREMLGATRCGHDPGTWRAADGSCDACAHTLIPAGEPEVNDRSGEPTPPEFTLLTGGGERPSVLLSIVDTNRKFTVDSLTMVRTTLAEFRAKRRDLNDMVRQLVEQEAVLVRAARLYGVPDKQSEGGDEQ